MILSSPISHGDVLVVAVVDILGCYGCGLVPTDTLGSSFTEATFAVCHNCAFPVSLFYANVTGTGGPSDNITFTDFTMNAAAVSSTAFDISGVTTAALETGTATGSCASSPCDMNTTATPFIPGAFLVGIAGVDSGGGGYTPGTGFTQAGSTFVYSSVLSAVEFSTSSSLTSPTTFPISISSSGGDWDLAGFALQPVTTVTVTTTVVTTTTTMVTKTPTTTKLSCSPNPDKAGKQTTCTAVVTSSLGAPPLGNVKFFSSKGGTFSKVTCLSSSTKLTCSVSYTPLSSLADKSTTISVYYYAPGASDYRNSHRANMLNVS